MIFTRSLYHDSIILSMKINITKRGDTMPRIRSVRETARIFKEMDQDTEITESTLRKMIASGTIPYVKSGNKYLLNVDLLLEILENPTKKEVESNG